MYTRFSIMNNIVLITPQHRTLSKLFVCTTYSPRPDTDDPPAIGCPITAFVAIYKPIYYMSHMRLARFSLTRLEQFFIARARRTDAHERDVA